MNHYKLIYNKIIVLDTPAPPTPTPVITSSPKTSTNSSSAAPTKAPTTVKDPSPPTTTEMGDLHFYIFHVIISLFRCHLTHLSIVYLIIVFSRL